MAVDASDIAGDEVEPPIAGAPGVQDTRHAVWRTKVVASRHHDQFGTRFANGLVVVIGNAQILGVLAHPNIVRPLVLRCHVLQFGQGAVAGAVVAEHDFNGLTNLVQAAHGGSFYRFLLVISQQKQRRRTRRVGVLGHRVSGHHRLIWSFLSQAQAWRTKRCLSTKVSRSANWGVQPSCWRTKVENF